jgi:hypothetical protein
VDALVGEPKRVAELTSFGERIPQGLQRQRARDLAGRVTTHPVGDRHERAPVLEDVCVDRVLLVGSLTGNRLDREARLL